MDRTQFRPSDAIVYSATITNNSSSSVTADVIFEVKDSRGQALIAPVTPFALKVGTSTFLYTSFIPSNALSGAYSVTASVRTPSQTVSKSASFAVTGGTTVPSVALEVPRAMTTQDVSQVSFRSGDTARFRIFVSNYTTQFNAVTVAYRLVGAGNFTVGSGTVSVPAEPGLASRIVDIAIPASAPFGLYTFVATTTGPTVNKVAAVTIGPRSVTESIELETVFVADTDGIPRTGIATGSTLNLFTSRLSSFITAQPATVRYKVTNSAGAAVLDESVAVDIVSGRTTGSIPFVAGAGGPHTFEATVTYQDNANATKTSTMSQQFNVGANTFPTPSISVRRNHIEDINGILRTTLNQGEFFLVHRAIYSTYPTPVTGSVRYEVGGVAGTLLNATIAATFNPGLNVNLLVISTTGSIPVSNYSYSMTATVQGQSSQQYDSVLFRRTRRAHAHSHSSGRWKGAALSYGAPYNCRGGL